VLEGAKNARDEHKKTEGVTGFRKRNAGEISSSVERHQRSRASAKSPGRRSLRERGEGRVSLGSIACLSSRSRDGETNTSGVHLKNN